MEKKKILIISYSYPPSNVPATQRPYAVAKYLNKDEFDVSVITCGNADVSWGVNEGFNPELLNEIFMCLVSDKKKYTKAIKEEDPFP